MHREAILIRILTLGMLQGISVTAVATPKSIRILDKGSVRRVQVRRIPTVVDREIVVDSREVTACAKGAI